jgi:FtsZ-binding cell division protein ZapB
MEQTTHAKSPVASRDGDLSKPATNITMEGCSELKDDVNCRRAVAIPGAPAYDSKRWNRGLRLAVLLLVMLGTCSALPAKPTRKSTKKETTTATAVQQGRGSESMEDVFTLRQRLAIMAGGAIAVMVTGYSLLRYHRISAELKQVTAGTDLLQKRLARLRGERDENLGQLASQSGENARLKSENAKLRSERDHWQRAAQEARAQAAAKQYSVDDLRKALGRDAGKDG